MTRSSTHLNNPGWHLQAANSPNSKQEKHPACKNVWHYNPLTPGAGIIGANTGFLENAH